MSSRRNSKRPRPTPEPAVLPQQQLQQLTLSAMLSGLAGQMAGAGGPPPAQAVEPGADQSDGDGCDGSSSDVETVRRIAKKKELRADAKVLASSSTFVIELPLKRLRRLVQALHSDLDSIATDDLREADLCRLLWLGARIKGCMQVSSFQATDYKTAAVKVVRHLKKTRREHDQKYGQGSFDTMIEKIVQNCHPDNVKSIADSMGHDDGWLDMTKYKKKGKVAQERSMINQQTLSINAGSFQVCMPPGAMQHFVADGRTSSAQTLSLGQIPFAQVDQRPHVEPVTAPTQVDPAPQQQAAPQTPAHAPQQAPPQQQAAPQTPAHALQLAPPQGQAAPQTPPYAPQQAPPQQQAAQQPPAHALQLAPTQQQAALQTLAHALQPAPPQQQATQQTPADAATQETHQNLSGVHSLLDEYYLFELHLFLLLRFLLLLLLFFLLLFFSLSFRSFLVVLL